MDVVTGLSEPVCVYINSLPTNVFNVSIASAPADQRVQNVQFTDRDPGWDYKMNSVMDPTRGAADSGDASLEEFFSRPLKIFEQSWAPGSLFFHTFNPWVLYFQNPRVVNRISNYMNMRCKLCVKVVVNGNSFYYGRAIMAYQPLHLDDTFTRDRGLEPSDMVAASQRPHIYIDPTHSQGGTLCLPFVWYKNTLSIPEEDWTRMGTMSLRAFIALRNTQGVTDPLTVSVFAWAEDMTLSTPTSDVPGALVPQAGEDEYATGMVSQPASTVARVAGALTSIPAIAPFARATEMVATMAANVARIFGYSRPVVLEPVVPYRPALLGNMANTDAPDSSTKLTVTSKQELSVDPRIVGLGSDDELNLKSLATRESFLTTFPWDISTPTESLLFTARVSPGLYRLGTLDLSERHMPACCFTGMPFKYWRGTMKFRFMVVGSSFHKGRLKIVYDPSFALSNEYNIAYTRVIDIGSERDFTVEIGWGNPFSYLEARDLGQFTGWGTTPFTGRERESNGVLSVYVVNELTTPNSTIQNDIEVAVFISTGDDIEFQVPDDSLDLLSYYPFIPPALDSQAGELDSAEAHTTTTDNAPVGDSEMQMAPSVDNTDNTTLVYFGEQIESFRSLLKRYNYLTTYTHGNTGHVVYRPFIADFPMQRGFTPAGYYLDVDNNPYNFSKMTLLNFLTPAFVCRRGGIRHKYCGIFDDDTARGCIAVSRSFRTFSSLTLTTGIPTPAGGGISRRVARRVSNNPDSIPGTQVSAVGPNPVAEVELPFYTNYRFFPARVDATSVASNDFQHTHVLSTTQRFQSNAPYSVDNYVAAGEDFSLNFFIGAPILYRYPDPEGSELG